MDTRALLYHLVAFLRLEVKLLIHLMRDLLEQVFHKSVALNVDDSLERLVNHDRLLLVERLNKVEGETKQHESRQRLALDLLQLR